MGMKIDARQLKGLRACAPDTNSFCILRAYSYLMDILPESQEA